MCILKEGEMNLGGLLAEIEIRDRFLGLKSRFPQLEFLWHLKCSKRTREPTRGAGHLDDRSGLVLPIR
jgi:hypothetical protein